jgi:hypothetical protein
MRTHGWRCDDESLGVYRREMGDVTVIVTRSYPRGWQWGVTPRTGRGGVASTGYRSRLAAATAAEDWALERERKRRAETVR